MVGTTRGGLFVLNENFQIIEGFYKDDHLKSTSVLSVGTDSYGNIWAGLHAGIACIDNSSNEYYYTDNAIGQVQSVLSDNTDVIVGTNKGLLLLDREKGKLTEVPQSQGVVWKLLSVNHSTIVLHDQGVFSFCDGKLNLIHKGGTMNMIRLNNENQYYIAGEYSGLSLYRLMNGELHYLHPIANYNGDTQKMYVDKNDNIWIPASGVGFIRLTLSANKMEVSSIKEYKTGSNTMLCTYMDDNLIFYEDGKALAINDTNDSLEWNPAISKLMKMCGENLQAFSQHGNKFWYKSNNDIGYVERKNDSLTKYSGIFEKVYRQRLTNDFFRVKEYTVLGFRNGLGFATSGRTETSRIKPGVIEAYGIRGTLTYNQSLDYFRIPFEMNNVRIYLTHVGPGKMIDYRIKGLSDEWTTVKLNHYISLPSLPAGTHIVEVCNHRQNATDILTIKLIVARPWYFSDMALVCYLIIICCIVWLTRRYYHRKNRREQEIIKKREKEKRERLLEIMEKEKLRNDVKEKDKKLANITMNSMKRNTMLNELKQEISGFSGIDDLTKLKSNVSRIVKRINSLMNNDENWEKAETYFNSIYDGLLDRLRMNYPNLSQTDLKLCVYIKLNLNTKEMAELMNISPRSIEMARYRLRKKLGLKPTENIGSVLQ